MFKAISAAAESPVLLTMGAYHGTLAAARCLGAKGIPVAVADHDWFALAHWSRFVKPRHRCPRLEEAERYVSWLLDVGRRSPGCVLYPTGDDVAWLFARYRTDLDAYFHLYQPCLDAVYALLNKQRLYEACREAGLDTPATWLVDEGGDLDRLAADLPYPLVVKPQTQVLRWPHNKGCVVYSREQLRDGYEQVVRSAAYSPLLLSHDPGVVRPVLQAFSPRAAQDIYSLSGFVDETGELFAIRASRKVLQRPRKLGVGLCFEG